MDRAVNFTVPRVITCNDVGVSASILSTSTHSITRRPSIGILENSTSFHIIEPQLLFSPKASATFTALAVSLPAKLLQRLPTR